MDYLTPLTNKHNDTRFLRFVFLLLVCVSYRATARDFCGMGNSCLQIQVTNLIRSFVREQNSRWFCPLTV